VGHAARRQAAGRRCRTTRQVALHIVASSLCQPFELRLSLDPLGDDFQMQAMCKADDGRADGCVLVAVVDVADE